MKKLILNVIGLVVAGSAPVLATPIYDNGAVGSTAAVAINGGYSVSDSFTISSATSLASAAAGLWVDGGALPVSLNWSIGTTPFGTDISSGTATLAHTFVDSVTGLDVYESTFTLSGVLGAGTYYFTLLNASASDGGGVSWDENHGPSSATLKNSANNTFQIGSESFQLYGASAPVPDQASTFLLLGLGCLPLIAFARRERNSRLACAKQRDNGRI